MQIIGSCNSPLKQAVFCSMHTKTGVCTDMYLTFIQWWMCEMVMKGMPVCFMHINMRTTSQTFTALPECDKNKNMI